MWQPRRLTGGGGGGGGREPWDNGARKLSLVVGLMLEHSIPETQLWITMPITQL